MFAGMLICTTALLLGADPATTQKAEKPEQVKLLPIEENVINYTNQARAQYGLPALQVDADLMKSARQHTVWMTTNQSLVHSNQPVAENIAMGQPNSQEVLQSWMNSSGHRANILNGSHGRIGVAAYRTAEGIIFWCQQFR
jgi:uncharacterized protein YkwD